MVPPARQGARAGWILCLYLQRILGNDKKGPH